MLLAFEAHLRIRKKRVAGVGPQRKGSIDKEELRHGHKQINALDVIDKSQKKEFLTDNFTHPSRWPPLYKVSGLMSLRDSPYIRNPSSRKTYFVKSV